MITVATYVFKLRGNIALESDLNLARMELEVFLGAVQDLADIQCVAPQLSELAGLSAPAAYARPNGQQAFTANGALSLLPELTRRLSFVQAIYCTTPDTPETLAFIHAQEATLGPVFAYHTHGDNLVILAVPHYALMELSDTVVRRAKKPDEVGSSLQMLLDALLGRTMDAPAVKLAEAALSAQSTTSHLSHDVHYYKAKFFPRMARAMLNLTARKLGDGPLRVIDNFVGSGTTLLEAALLGIASVGLDIDPLSVLIARTKLDVLKLDSALVAWEAGLAAARLQAQASGQRDLFDPLPQSHLPSITFPRWLLKNRKMTDAAARELIGEIDAVRAVAAACDPQVSDLFRVLMSDAIARRIRMRFLGTGVGRFSLTFSKTPLASIFARSLAHYARVIAAWTWLRETLHLELGEAQVFDGDTRQFPAELGLFDILLTSPPYLPASSGRESYARARAPSLLALGLADSAQVDTNAIGLIGVGDAAVLSADLTGEERAVVEWLKQDDLRAIKAGATARYFLDMRRSFAEMYRVLRPGGRAVVVSGKQSTFYRFSTRDVLYVVHVAAILADEARRAGFEVEALLDMPLKKANLNARPRSLDDYYETLILLWKPV